MNLIVPVSLKKSIKSKMNNYRIKRVNQSQANLNLTIIKW